MAKPNVVSTETNFDYAHMRYTETDSLLHIFIRFVKPGEISNLDAIDTFDYGDDISIDKVGDRIIGISLSVLKSRI
jgi:hypothetical protein